MTYFSPHQSSQIQPQSQTDSIAVVGAGIIGVCTALTLQKQGFRVTLIDGKGVAQACSKGNAGHFATEQVFPLANIRLLPQLPKMLLDPLGPFRIRMDYLLKALPWFCQFLANMRTQRVEDHTKALKALNQEAIAAYQSLLKDAKLESAMRLDGSLLTFENPKSKSIAQQLTAFRRQGVNVEKLDQKQLKALEPNLSDKVQAALYFKDVGHSCDPEALALGLYQEFLRLGGRFQQQNVVAIRPHSVGVEVKSCGSSLRYSKLVLAAGAWSHTLLAPLGYRIPLEAERGYHLMIEQHNLLSRPVASADRSFIMTPMAGGLRLAGTVEFAGLDAEKNERRAKGLLPHAKALLKGIKKSNDEIDEHSTWMGCRPSLPDSLPVIGPASKHKNLYLAFGHQHLGLTQGAITAKLITQLIAGHTPELDLRPYSISRFEK